ncbi:putative carboxypeptidase [Triangularia setosa]|uniref:Carboxypeptidase n=1 Tax=Triangularia setosa TaxID=2587417 RepID=A0AAN6VXT5_9PEZI|nr:putative carboxypeptidase [Podospora setosa]
MSIFFWYFQARKNPGKAPASIYIGGGPGSSALDETNGFPCSFNSDGNSTRVNEQAWNEEVNMLYIDQPVGAGFSYSKIVNGVVNLMDSLSEDGSFFTPGTLEELQDGTNLTVAPVTIQSLDPRDGVNTTQQAARVMWWFSQVWFQEFPGYDTSNKDISLWTVSYGGFYGPAFLAHFHRQSATLPDAKQPNSIPLQLSTLGIQNGCMDVLTIGLSYLDFSVNNTYDVRAYPEEVYTAAKTNLTEFCQPLLLSCRQAISDGDRLGYGNNQTVNEACAIAAGVCFGFVQGAFTSYSQLNPFDITLSHPETFPALHWVNYLNQPWVQSALGVPVNFTAASRVSSGVFFALTGDPMRHDLSDLTYLLQKGIKVAMVYGDLDYRCNWFGAEEISLAVGGEKFKEAGYAEVKMVGEKVGGMVREVEGLSFVRVFDAGHSVYTYQPEAVNEVFRRVMNGRDVATGEREVDGGYKTEGPQDVRGLKVKASEGRDAGCFLADVGRTCDEGQIEALVEGRVRVENGMVVEPGRRGEKNQDGKAGNGVEAENGDVEGRGKQEQVKSAGAVMEIVGMAPAALSQNSRWLHVLLVGSCEWGPSISLPPSAICKSFNDGKGSRLIYEKESTRMASPPRSARSKRGCITCRIRRVKCDETRPQCTRCTKAGRTCDGYAATSSQLSGRELAAAVKMLQVVGPAARVLGEAVLTEDSACFDFFRMCTVAMTSTAFPAPFWSRHVLQVAHSEPAVWRAAVAVGALHRRWESRSKIRLRPNPIHSERPVLDKTEEFTKQAMQQYWSAISMAQTIHDPSVLMVMSVILAAAANMGGEWAAGHVHIQSGLKLVASKSHSPNETMSSEIASIAQSLSRLDLLVMTFEDSRAPYAYVDPLTGQIPSSILNMPRVGKLDDLMQASMHLFGMFRYFLSVEGGYIMGYLTQHEMLPLQTRITQDIITWKSEFEVLANRVLPLASKAERTTILSLELYHSILSLMSRAGISGPAVRWDAYTDEFTRVISLCETINNNIFSPLPFFMSLEPGLIMPLFLTITRCRHPLVRRRGLRLLKSLNRQEGMWNSPAACVVAEQKVLAEEEHVTLPLPLYIENLDNMPMEGPTGEGWEKSMAPEELRVIRDELVVDVEKGRIELVLFTVVGGEEREMKRLSLGY